MRLFRKKPAKLVELDEVLLDATNIPAFNQGRLEGKRELPISILSVYAVGVVFILVTGIFLSQIFFLQVIDRSIPSMTVNVLALWFDSFSIRSIFL